VLRDHRAAVALDEGWSRAAEDPVMAMRIEKIAPVVVPSGGTQLAPETIVFGLDEEGGLWRWDPSQKTDRWTQVCRPLAKA
jgi:hypothetical protein